MPEHQHSGIQAVWLRHFHCLWLLSLLTICAPPVLGADDSWQLTLPSQDGQRFVSLSELPGPILVNFWGVDCPPCIAELPMLATYASQQKDWQVVLVNTDGAAAAQRFLEAHAISGMESLTMLRPGLNITGLMRKAGNLHGVLPYSVAVNSRHHICFRKAGALQQEDFKQMAAVCR